MIRAIVFDLGGVLFADGKAAALERLEREEGYDKEIIRSMVFASKELEELRKGLINDEACWDAIRSQLPTDYDPARIRHVWYESYTLNEEVFSLIKHLHGRYLLASFSGNTKSRLLYLEEKYRFRKYFAVEVYSFDYHLNKPDPRFVDAMIVKVAVPSEEMVYIDDAEEGLVPARKRGAHTVLFNGDMKDLTQALHLLGVQ